MSQSTSSFNLLNRRMFAALVFVGAASPSVATTYVRPPYGCYQVKVDGLNIRERPFAASAAIGTARLGQIVVKTQRFCNWRGYFCEVEVTGANGRPIRGYADKNFMTVAPCPASLAKPLN